MDKSRIIIKKNLNEETTRMAINAQLNKNLKTDERHTYDGVNY